MKGRRVSAGQARRAAQVVGERGSASLAAVAWSMVDDPSTWCYDMGEPPMDGFTTTNVNHLHHTTCDLIVR